jgi:hypothetical protein
MSQRRACCARIEQLPQRPCLSRHIPWDPPSTSSSRDTSATSAPLSPPPNLTTRISSPLRHHPCPPRGRHPPSYCFAASSSCRYCLGVGSKPRALIEVWFPGSFFFPRLAHGHRAADGRHCHDALRAPHVVPLQHPLSTPPHPHAHT